MKNLITKSILGLSSLFIALSTAQAHEGAWHSNRADAHAPISVMQDHTHNKNEWMLSYRYMNMDMEGMRQGTNDLSSSQVFANGYMVTPTQMTMEMHMFGLMYAPHSKVTLMAMTNYTEKDMDHATMPGSRMETMLGSTFNRKSSGWGDTTIAALISVFERDNHKIHINAGLSLPTGSIDESDRGLLPYPMQLGSGTYDLKPGITYSGQSDLFSWGAQIMGRFAIDENDAGYSLGDQIETTVWSAYKITDWVSFSGSLNYENTSSIDGFDRRITARMNPTMDPANSGGESLFLGLGANFLVPKGPLKGHRLAVEYLTPLEQDFNGIQMQTDHVITVGWQKAF